MKNLYRSIRRSVRHYSTVEIEATDTVRCDRQGAGFRPDRLRQNPDWHNAVCRRIVEVTDETRNRRREFIPIATSPFPPLTTQERITT